MNKLIEKRKVVEEIRYIQDDFEFYAQLLESWQKFEGNKTEREIWICRKIIELMDNLRFSANREFVQNALILLLSLYNDECKLHEANASKQLKEPSKDETNDIFIILESEFIPF